MTREADGTPQENLGWGHRKKHDPTLTLAKSYDEEGDYDIDNAIWDLQLYKKFGYLDRLKSAQNFIKNAVKEYNYAEHLRGNTLEEYIQEEKK